MNTNVKRPHSLHTLPGPAAFLAALAAEGIDLDDVLSVGIRSGAEAGVLLVGSLAEGVGNQASDIDLLVLVESREDIALGRASVTLQAGRSVESLQYRSGVEVNLEIFAREDVERLMASFTSIAPALYNPTELKHIPLLQLFDLRFLHRLTNGWILRGEALVHQWRDEFLTELLPTYLVVLNLNIFNEFFEDATALVNTHPTSAIYIGRTCVEYALLAAFAQAGFTGQSKKWLLHWRDQLAATIDVSTVDVGIDLLLNVTSGADARAYLRRIASFGKRVMDELKADPEIRQAIEFLSERIAYVPFEPVEP